MDPYEALKEWQRSGSSEARRALNEWLEKGGFRPRVAFAPHTHQWLSGIRYGEVVKVGRRYLHVQQDGGLRLHKVSADSVLVA